MSPRCRSSTPAGWTPVPALVTVVTSLALLAGCTSGDVEDDTPAPRPSAADASFDLSGLPVPRVEFCDLLDEAAVQEALGGEVAGTAHYGNGDDLEVRPGEVDVSHEYGCVFSGSDGAVARAWIFARPVRRAEARTLVRRHPRGCATPDLLVFGRPGLVSVCEVPVVSPDGGEVTGVRARFEGLFTDTWVGCEVSEPLPKGPSAENRPDVVQRAATWCTELVTMLGAS